MGVHILINIYLLIHWLPCKTNLQRSAISAKCRPGHIKGFDEVLSINALTHLEHKI